MHGYWLTFTDGSHGYCEGYSEYDAKRIAEKLTGKTVAGGERRSDIAAKPLPYPANPIIWQVDHPLGKCPAFCYRPQQCAGKTSCPQSHACTD